jgi:hypothetical protein
MEKDITHYFSILLSCFIENESVEYHNWHWLPAHRRQFRTLNSLYCWYQLRFRIKICGD